MWWSPSRSSLKKCAKILISDQTNKLNDHSRRFPTMNSGTSEARAKKVLKVEKTEDTSKEAVKKKTFLRKISLSG